ncbi:MAG: hypothetical protein M1826_004276 [Phylliscum demangeonii]|nr:MAG: hypothetical protein M1826_004276 [Phylliscum demangeonii]
MNVDPNRERSQVPGLDQAKLRRVAFCVDVEIARNPKYKDDNAERKGKRPRNEKDKKPKEKEEVEKLEQVDIAKPEVSTNGVGAEMAVNEVAAPLGYETIEKETSANERESAAEREGDENNTERSQGQPSGSLSADDARHGNGSASETTAATTTAAKTSPRKHEDRPTTDPLRVYRRCCLLRETQALKRVVDQLSSPDVAAGASAGVVSLLDLSNLQVSVADAVTLADWLAVVPVKRLKLENCDLGDEAVRVILCGLYACSPPHDGRQLIKKPSQSERRGAIEKLCLKNNPKIGREGWRCISLFLHLSRSIKAVDLSLMPFPQPITSSQGHGVLAKFTTDKEVAMPTATLLSKAIAERLAGPHLEELNLSECGLSTDDVEKILDAVSKSGLRRLGLASNHLTSAGLEHVSRFIRLGQCEGLDLGGNDLRDRLAVVSASLEGKNPLYALSLADCNLTPSSLSDLFPALESLPNFRFIDLSHNQHLFSTQPDALGLLRKHLPRLHNLKRIHLEDVAMSSHHCIALAEILPEMACLAHLSILDNPQLSALASADDETSQEEACALFASLMAAVRVSNSIVCIDVDVPSQNSSEIVKALAKQVVAYCLRNMEHGAMAEYDAVAASGLPGTEADGSEKPLAVPDILLHIVGHVEGYPEDLGTDEPAPDRDYVIGGTGVVKALGVCLGNNSSNSRHASGDDFLGGGGGGGAGSGTATPKATLREGALGKGKAKEMSKNLLGSARKIRARLQPALIKEETAQDDMNYRRLLFLDQTLERMIQRFEDEYPECRLRPAVLPVRQASNNLHDVRRASADANPASSDSGDSSPGTSMSEGVVVDRATPEFLSATDDDDGAESEPAQIRRTRPSRHGSDVSLASRALALEEGRMHRFGQQIQRDILRPQGLDHAHGTTGLEPESEHLHALRQRLQALGGMEIKERVIRDGLEAVMREMGANADELQRLAVEQPACFDAARQVPAVEVSDLGAVDRS